MTTKRIGILGVSAAVLGLAVYGVSALAQQPTGKEKPGSATNPARMTAHPAAEPQVTTITGRVVDLQCFMTGQFASADHAMCMADCIRAGVPAALETPNGLVILGEGATGPQKTILPFASKRIEATGKLYNKDGVKYLDLTSVKPAVEE